MTARILLFDIEISANEGYYWGNGFKTDIIKQTKDWYMLTWSAKWYGENRVMADSLHYYDGYEEHLTDDYDICHTLYDLMDEADIVVAHNGNKFDIKKINTRFAYHGFKPYAPFKAVDTLAIARNHFGFTRNRLDELGEFFGVGRKIKTDFSLWEGCMNGDDSSFEKMVKYNKQDVKLLEKVYDILKPWTPRHPNMAMYTDTDKPVCAHCGSLKLDQYLTPYYTNTQKYRKFQCKDCGGWSRLRTCDGRVQKSTQPATIVADRK